MTELEEIFEDGDDGFLEALREAGDKYKVDVSGIVERMEEARAAKEPGFAAELLHRDYQRSRWDGLARHEALADSRSPDHRRVAAENRLIDALKADHDRGFELVMKLIGDRDSVVAGEAYREVGFIAESTVSGSEVLSRDEVIQLLLAHRNR